MPACSFQSLVQTLVQPRTVKPWVTFPWGLLQWVDHQMMLRQIAIERSNELQMDDQTRQCLLGVHMHRSPNYAMNIKLSKVCLVRSCTQMCDMYNQKSNKQTKTNSRVTKIEQTNK